MLQKPLQYSSYCLFPVQEPSWVREVWQHPGCSGPSTCRSLPPEPFCKNQPTPVTHTFHTMNRIHKNSQSIKISILPSKVVQIILRERERKRERKRESLTFQQPGCDFHFCTWWAHSILCRCFLALVPLDLPFSFSALSPLCC